jgi:hypothetical protein
MVGTMRQGLVGGISSLGACHLKDIFVETVKISHTKKSNITNSVKFQDINTQKSVAFLYNLKRKLRKHSY